VATASRRWLVPVTVRRDGHASSDAVPVAGSASIGWRCRERCKVAPVRAPAAAAPIDDAAKESGAAERGLQNQAANERDTHSRAAAADLRERRKAEAHEKEDPSAEESQGQRAMSETVPLVPAARPAGGRATPARERRGASSADFKAHAGFHDFAARGHRSFATARKT